MIADMLFRSFRSEKPRGKKTRGKRSSEEEKEVEERNVYSVPFYTDPLSKTNNTFCLKSRNIINDDINHRKGRSIKKMSSKASNFSDLIQRVTASCLLHPLAGVSRADDFSTADEDEDYDHRAAAEEEEEEDFKIHTNWGGGDDDEPPRTMELEILMGQVFDAVSSMKRAYVSLQEAHSPWDPDKMRVSDVAELKREVKAQQAEMDNLKEKLKTASLVTGKSKGKSRRRVSCTTQVAVAPAVELFEATMSLVKEASKAFTSLLLSLMRSAHWDIAAAVRSIEAASSTATSFTTGGDTSTSHAKYALESYVNRKIFQGFDHETFYMDGSLSSILHPDQHRTDCFTQYRDMKAMDPAELLGILPSCGFGNFCFKKYLAVVHPKMEESLFGDLEQRRQVLDGHHPRSQFYGEFLGLAKSVWLLHLLAFSLDPPPGHFEASKGADFHSQYMESVVKNNKVGISMVVGFPVSPGFKLGNGSIVKARVYLVPKN